MSVYREISDDLIAAAKALDAQAAASLLTRAEERLVQEANRLNDDERRLLVKGAAKVRERLVK